MEYLLIFHIIVEHVQYWLKIDVLLQTLHRLLVHVKERFPSRQQKFDQ